ncbi:MICAL-like protein 1 isoform X2 [Clavelina lepadiformis]|uniref:MICAL-like protein 1 isoform X2 n=1 Tax=Clavelina lepadiformis TaxID=159417 RepID=UPI00404247EF
MAGKMKALQMWCKRNTEGYKDVNVVNMTTSWRDGLAFCALIHRFRPDLIDFESLSKENILHNNQLAFRTAENELGIAALLDAEDMVAMKVPDKLSIITYVSQYYNSLHKLKPADAKPLKRPSSPKQVPETVEVKRKPVEPKKVIPPTNQPLAEKSQVFSTCEVCKKKVHLVERYIDEGKVYHRQCHRTKSLSGMYRRDKSTPFYEDGSWKKPHQEVASIKKPSPFASDPPKEKKSIEKPVPMFATPKLDVKHAAANLDAVSKNSRFSTPTATSSTPSSGKSSPNPEKQASKVIEMALAYAQKNESKQKSSPTHSQGNITTAAVTNIALDATDSVFGSKSAHVVEKPAETTDDDIITNIPGRESRLTKKEEELNPFAMDASSEVEENVPDSKSVIGSNSQKPTKDSDKIPQFQKSQNPKSEAEQVKADENNAAKVPHKIHCDDETKEMLPALLKSLAGVKEKQSHEKSEAIKTDNKDVSSSDIAPLVSELPKATPLAKPRYVAKTAVQNATNPKNLQSATTKSPTRKPALSSHKQLHKPSRPAPGFGFPLVKRRVKNQMTEEEIQNEMMVLDIQLKDLEKKGVKLEEVLRDEMEMGVDWKNESDQMLGEWFELVHDKNKLVRRETELVFLMQQQRLEQEHADVEFKIRKLLNKPESEKTEEEKKEEKKLLDQLVDIVERRNTIINSIEEERVKEEKEDAAYNQIMMLQRESPSDSDSTKKKKKNKVKKIFSKRKKAPKSSSAEEQCSSSQPSSR